MEHLIRFKSLTEQMSKRDIRQMVISLMDQEDGVSEQTMMKALWSHAYMQYKANDSCFIHKMNGIASKIKSSVKNDDENDDQDGQPAQQPQSPINVDALPDVMINNIGTFLDYTDVFRMEQVNRKFFVSLRFPFPALERISVYEWIGTYITYCKKAGLPINFDRFRGISELCIDGEEIDTHASLFGNAFKSVSEIHIENVCDLTMQAMHSIFNPDVISRLYCCIDATGADPFQFKNMLSQLRNLQFLQIDCDGEPSDGYMSDFESLMEHGCLPNLIHLYSGFSARINRTILDTSTSKVQSFSIYSDETFYDDMVLYSQCQQLKHLRELQFWCTPSDLSRYLHDYGWSRMPNLKAVVFKFEIDDRGPMNEFDLAIDGVFENSMLERIEFSDQCSTCGLCEDKFMRILESLEMALLKYNRQRLTLCLTITQFYRYSVSLLRLVNSMRTSVFNGFGLVLETSSLSTAPTPEMQKVLQVLSRTLDVEYNQYDYVYIHTKGYRKQEWLSETERLPQAFD